MARPLLQAVADMDVWQEADGSSSLYLAEEFGLSDPLDTITEEIHAAEAEGLVRIRTGSAGSRWWELTDAGREELRRLSAADQLTRVTEIIEPMLDGQWRRSERARGAAQDLEQAGLLVGGSAQPGRLPFAERAAAVLQCRLSWGPAEEIVRRLAAAGLLKTEG